MTNQHQLLLKVTKSVANLSELNPQFLRELKGRFKGINIIIATCVSLIMQLFVILRRLGQLPPLNYGEKEYSRYCFGQSSHSNLCQTNLLGIWDINWQLFWLDIFIDLSVVMIISLLIVGVYLLITDLIKEQQRGTLSFIQFSPQPASSILIGKILGVPILVYLAILLAFPLHCVAAFQAGISLSLIGGFDLTVIVCCGLFYSIALLFSLLKTNFITFKPLLGSGIVALFLLSTMDQFSHAYNLINYNISDWLLLCNPATILPYLIKQSNLLNFYDHYFSVRDLREISFYGQHLWYSSSVAIGFILVNYCLWQYWVWQGLKRCFVNPNNTSFSKAQTYWITGYFIFYALGFTLQTTSSDHLFSNFLLLQCSLVIFFVGLIVVLNPQNHILQDWARYRHQFSRSQRNLWLDLLLGEKSPSIVSLMVNLAIITFYTIPALLIFDFTQSPREIIWGLILQVSILSLYGFIAQFILLTKYRKRTTWSLVTVVSLAVIPYVFLEISDIAYNSNAFLITFLPTLAIDHVSVFTMLTVLLGQWLTISLTGFAITKQLHQLGQSETSRIS